MRQLRRLLGTTFADWWNDNTFRLSASLAFYTIFSLAPVLVIAVQLAAIFFGRDVAVAQVVGEIELLAGPEAGRTVRTVLDNFAGLEGNRWAVIVSLVTIVVGATVVFAELQAALNRIWDVETRPGRNVFASLLRTRLTGFALALSVGFLLLVSLVIDAGLAGFEAWLEGRVPTQAVLWRGLNTAASFAIITLLFMAIYRYLPDARIEWRDVTFGALVSAVLLTGGKYLIGLYLGKTAVGSAYGAAGSFVVMLVWIYYSALIAFLGAEFTQVWARLYGRGIHPEPYAHRVGNKPNRC